ncbi:hypothetical protein FGO68_gene8472 [Halteria grandinella]|uniref:Uncharacterized protein n=1 Tax=Halteria grandinella TaxID=5974 RepID=A0A8J8NIZ6_HALGN|nr:hypothetical protein FGO68_gene8472 [Halteria grandinella]
MSIIDEQNSGVINKVRTHLTANDYTDQQMWRGITNVPRLERPIAYGVCAANVIVPGLGTLVASAKAVQGRKTLLVLALLQFFTAYMVFGWVASIYWGILIVQKAHSTDETDPIIPRPGDPTDPLPGQPRYPGQGVPIVGGSGMGGGNFPGAPGYGQQQPPQSFGSAGQQQQQDSYGRQQPQYSGQSSSGDFARRGF